MNRESYAEQVPCILKLSKPVTWQAAIYSESHAVMDVSKSLHPVFDQAASKDTNLTV